MKRIPKLIHASLLATALAGGAAYAGDRSHGKDAGEASTKGPNSGYLHAGGQAPQSESSRQSNPPPGMTTTDPAATGAKSGYEHTGGQRPLQSEGSAAGQGATSDPSAAGSGATTGSSRSTDTAPSTRNSSDGSVGYESTGTKMEPASKAR